MENEAEVLKEMIRSSQTQIKSKDVDIQRLNIKIKRLDKQIEMDQVQFKAPKEQSQLRR